MLGHMSNVANHSPRVLFLGMQGNFSHPSLRALLEHGIEVCAVVIPSAPHTASGLPAIVKRDQPRAVRSMLPLLQSSLHTSIVQIAWEQRIPVWEVRHLSDPEVLSTLGAYKPDMICVACFPQRIPRTLLDLPRLGCLNVHPALLPANRGPVPLFWTFHEGQQQTGVTIHQMDEVMDTGDILAQASIEVPDGVGYAQLESQCAVLGGALLAETTWKLYQGDVVRIPQDEAKSSYFPFPGDDAFIVRAVEWSAQRIYNFICGVADWGGPVTIQVDDQYIPVKNGISYSHENIDTVDLQKVITVGEEELDIRCKDGWVRIRVR